MSEEKKTNLVVLDPPLYLSEEDKKSLIDDLTRAIEAVKNDQVHYIAMIHANSRDHEYFTTIHGKNWPGLLGYVDVLHDSIRELWRFAKNEIQVEESNN